MFNNNSYMNNQYTPYMSYQQPSYMGYQQQVQQPRQQMPMEQPQNQDIPFSEVRYGTLDEAKGYIVAPNRAVMFIDQDKFQFYIKRADGMGKPYLETYKYSSLDKLSNEQQTRPTETDLFVKPEQLKDFLTPKDIEGFITRKDLEDLYEKIEQLQKKVQIKNIVEDSK